MDIKLIISIFSAIISLISLAFAFRVYKVFHRREIQKKQTEIVLSLIANIQEKPIWLRWIKFNEKSSDYISLSSGNLFAVAKALLGQTHNDLTELSVYFSEETNNRLKVSEFLFNPLLPKDIADCLKIAFQDEVVYVDTKKHQNDFVYIDESRTFDAKALKENFPLSEEQYYCTYHVNLQDFIIGLNQLREAINIWLKKVGVKDLNLFWES